MAPEDTIVRFVMTEPIAQIAIALSGILLLWHEFRDIRKRLNAVPPAADRRAAVNLCNDLIGVRAKVLVGGVIVVLFGLCFLLASGISTELAFGLFTILIFTTVIPSAVYFLFWGAPDHVLRWFLRDQG